MSNEVQTAIAGAEPKPVGKNISNSELIAMRFKALTGVDVVKKPPQEQSTSPEAEIPAKEAAPEAEAQTEHEPKAEGEAPKEESGVLSKDVDLENMSEAELKELAQKLGSKAVARFGELTAKRKSAEEQLAALKSEISKRNDSQLEAKVRDNPYADIEKADELQSKFQEVNEIIDWADDLLEKSEDLGSDDIVTTVNGKDHTKREIKDAMRKAKKARDIYLPDQKKKLLVVQERQQFRETLISRAKTELPWLNGEDNDVRKQYELMVSDERLKALEKSAPEVASQLPYLLAHAANSLYARKSVDAKASARLAPPSAIISQSVESNKPDVRQSRAIKDISDRFQKNGNYRDFQKLRALQHSR
jgi:hypothetical protein